MKKGHPDGQPFTRYGPIPVSDDLSDDLKVHGLRTACVRLDIETHLLTFRKTRKTGTFDRGNMHEHILGAVVRGDEAEASRLVEKFYRACRHDPAFAIQRPGRAYARNDPSGKNNVPIRGKFKVYFAGMPHRKLHKNKVLAQYLAMKPAK